MLSTNKRTSCLLTSLKCSAIVNADKPTRILAPGGSFIWPKQSATLDCLRSSALITPDSLNSSYKSFPSRVLSPTPPKTDTPPCSFAILFMSSWIKTVLPTPAPPNNPTFPPCR